MWVMLLDANALLPIVSKDGNEALARLLLLNPLEPIDVTFGKLTLVNRLVFAKTDVPTVVSNGKEILAIPEPLKALFDAF